MNLLYEGATEGPLHETVIIRVILYSLSQNLEESNKVNDRRVLIVGLNKDASQESLYRVTRVCLLYLFLYDESRLLFTADCTAN